MPPSESQDELLKRAATHAQRVLAQVRDQHQDLNSNRHIEAAVGLEGSSALTMLEQSLASLLEKLNQSLDQLPKNDQP